MATSTSKLMMMFSSSASAASASYRNRLFGSSNSCLLMRHHHRLATTFRSNRMSAIRTLSNCSSNNYSTTTYSTTKTTFTTTATTRRLSTAAANTRMLSSKLRASAPLSLALWQPRVCYSNSYRSEYHDRRREYFNYSSFSTWTRPSQSSMSSSAATLDHYYDIFDDDDDDYDSDNDDTTDILFRSELGRIGREFNLNRIAPTTRSSENGIPSWAQQEAHLLNYNDNTNSAINASMMMNRSELMEEYDDEEEEDDDQDGFGDDWDSSNPFEQQREQQQSSQQQQQQESQQPQSVWSSNNAVQQQQNDSFQIDDSLALELGEVSKWDLSALPEEEEDDDFEEEIQQQQTQQGVDEDPMSLQKPPLTAEELLQHFNPEVPPASNHPEEIQLWLECESQLEAARKYKKMLQQARDRKDYKLLSQSHVLQWFDTLRDDIAKRQEIYITDKENMFQRQRGSSNSKQQQPSTAAAATTKTGRQKQKGSQQQQSPTTKNSDKFPRLTVYGPFLCLLSPEKLAVITAHEALMHTLNAAGGGSRSVGEGGIPFAALAKRIGEAVEDEFLMQRVLLKRALEQRTLADEQRKQRLKELQLEGAVEDLLNDTATNNNNIDSNNDTVMLQSSDDEQNNNSNDNTNTNNSGNLLQSWNYSSHHLENYLDELTRYSSMDSSGKQKAKVAALALRRARRILECDTERWSEKDKIDLGAALFQMLLQNATVKIGNTPAERKWRAPAATNGSTAAEDDDDDDDDDQGAGGRRGPKVKEEPAFFYEKRWTSKYKHQGFVRVNDHLFKMIVSEDYSMLLNTTTRHKPMIVPPKAWKDSFEGGYLWLRTDMMRYHGCQMQKEALKMADLSTVCDGLNALGRVPWQINNKILEVAQRCWDENIPIGDIPSRTDFQLPPDPGHPPRIEFTPNMDKTSPVFKAMVEEQRLYREAMHKYRRFKQKNMDLRSLRCSAILKLDQARKFKNFEKIYFPYNVDFRGRAYPVPPHLSNVGSDLCRGMLKFAEGKPLGPRGFFWIKVHLANLAGKDKMTFENRAAFVDEHMDQIRASVADPFAGERWWMSLEDPFQGLSTCIEIINAIDSGNPETYECSLPVHMDGSCNGLQHYAALGRDIVGGKAVNLCAMNEPQDVYIGVMEEVIKRVAAEAERELDFDTSNPDELTDKQKKVYNSQRAARLVNGLIDRGVVKRTVMTSVYGVTFIGARTQIQEKVEPKLEQEGYDLDEIDREVFHACGYLARVTMDVMGDLFQGARQTMNWLTTCGRLISQAGYPVAWISPIGLPAIQPYRRKKVAQVTTLMQTVVLTDDSDELPIHKQRQVTALPPNYVHSLDSSHMLLTALEMDRRGLYFSAVHDSFWTHACDIDEMNEALRDVFVDLYNQPLLERLKEQWELRYPHINFPDLPERGVLDLDDIKKAKYFFQ